MDEKATIEEKIKKAAQNPIKLDSTVYQGKYDLDAHSVRNYVRTALKGKTYKNGNENIYIGKRGMKKTVGQGGSLHRKSIAHIPTIIENTVIIPLETQAYKEKAVFDTYKYGVLFIILDNNRYLVKVVFGKNERRQWEYYTHALLQIKNGSAPTSGLLTPVELVTSISNDTALSLILQDFFDRNAPNLQVLANAKTCGIKSARMRILCR